MMNMRREQDGQPSILTPMRRTFEKRPVLGYYVLTFVISWGLFLIVGGPGLVSGADWEDNPAFVFAVLAMLTGPAIAGLTLTALLSGRPGLRELGARLTKWRVDVRWYVIAIATTPLVSMAVLMALSIASPDFRPPILTDEGSPAAILLAIGIGTTTLLEELGWTGFATPRLRRQHSVFATGLIMGVPWALWHLLQITWVASTTSETLPMALYLTLYVGFSIASLTAYRILIVWVYDRTGSLLVATLMHASYAGFTLQIDFILPTLTGGDLLIQGWVFSAALWMVVAAVVMTSRDRAGEFFAQRPQRPPAAKYSIN
jgi:membrane protease YdiL (CAAX protease family)